MTHIGLDDLASQFGKDRVRTFSNQSGLQSLDEALAPQTKIAIELAADALIQVPSTHIEHIQRLNGMGFTITTKTALASDASATFAEKLVYLLGLSQSNCNTLRTVLHETLLNSAIHGNLEIESPREKSLDTYRDIQERTHNRLQDNSFSNRVITVAFGPEGDFVRFVVADEGPGFDVTAVQKEILEAKHNHVNGRGLKMINGLAGPLQFFDDGSAIEFSIKRR